ncbi:hypothetical protein GSI_04500 [Ganoderma sinense ZZ0214-1]|uniref:Uncharacterized protein n=1 Tax=Ganoderma sinense ZZ0214-1 TaxID=1077348 RepID=A0A2G8SH26_9APHY|nr:hypothetical protein GSI_04500 [Ganoderma sinense ZZ0214-1]
MVISYDSARVVTSSLDGTIIVWDTASGTVLQEWLAHEGSVVVPLALSPDNRRVVSAGGSTITAWNIDSGCAAQKTAELNLEGNTGVVNTCIWSPDGALIASVSGDKTVTIWDGCTYQQRDVLPATPSSQNVRALQFSPDGHYLAWISGGKVCCVWTPLALAETQPKTLLPHPDREEVSTTAFAFDHESRRIATAHGDLNSDPDACVVRIWDAATGAPLAVLAGHSEAVSRVSFSSDGRSLLSVSEDMAVRLWDCGAWSGEQTGVFGDSGESLAWHTCFRHDGKYMAAGLEGGRVQLWRMGDGSCVATFGEHDSDVTHVAFSPNGRFLVSGDRDGIVHIRCISTLIGE